MRKHVQRLLMRATRHPCPGGHWRRDPGAEPVAGHHRSRRKHRQDPAQDGRAGFCREQMAQAVSERHVARKRRGAARGDGRGDGHPHVFPAAVQNPDRLDAADACSASPRKTTSAARRPARRPRSFKIPTGWERIKEWFEGISYVHVVAQADGAIDAISPMTHFLIFNIRQIVFDWRRGARHLVSAGFRRSTPGRGPAWPIARDYSEPV